MKSRKEIKGTAIKIWSIVISNSSRSLLFMALVGGFFAANLRQNGRLTLINQAPGSVTTTFDGEREYNEPLEENLCATMIRNFGYVNYEYKVKAGIITKEQIEKDEAERKKRMKEIDDRLAKGDTNVLFEDSKENRQQRETEEYIARFVETCESTLGKKAKKGYWWTVIAWTLFSWIGLRVASEINS